MVKHFSKCLIKESDILRFILVMLLFYRSALLMKALIPMVVGKELVLTSKWTIPSIAPGKSAETRNIIFKY